LFHGQKKKKCGSKTLKASGRRDLDDQVLALAALLGLSSPPSGMATVLGSGSAKTMADRSKHLAQPNPLDHVEVKDCSSDEDSAFEDASLDGSNAYVEERNHPSVEEQVGGKMLSEVGSAPT
ncbi:unnamed protein product, partial [Dovyalis caffra]